MSVTELELKALQRPLSLRWRVQRAIPNKDNPTHVILVGYIDSRMIQEVLDKEIGIGNWQTKYYECKGKQFCEIGIKINNEWVWKGDSGSPTMTEKEKGETSDSFKRAAVHWGINRVAYQVGEVKLKCSMYNKKPYPCDDNGKFLKGEALNSICNKLGKIDEFELEFDKSFDMLKSEKIDTVQAIENAQTIEELDELKSKIPDSQLSLFNKKRKELK